MHLLDVLCRAGVTKCLSLQDHLNRREKVGLSFSPCMRYLAVGSEDRACYIYDLRTSRVVSRTQVSNRSLAQCPSALIHS